MAYTFTDRFVELPVIIYDSKTEELTGQQGSTDVKSFMKILPYEIYMWRPHLESGELVKEECIIELKTGDSIRVLLSVEKLENKLNEHFDKERERANHD